jgi:hypothetical protein
LPKFLKTQNYNNMKKLLLSFSLFAITAISANAQIAFGFKAGLNVATFSGSDASTITGKGSRSGLNVGGQVKIPVSSNFSVQPELVYSMQGCKFTGGTYEVNYINVPVLAQYRFGASSFSAATGPQIGFLASAKAKSGGTTTDVKDDTKAVDFSWAFNLAYKLAMGLGFNARYNLGLTTIDKNTGGGTAAKINNSVFQIGAFWEFGGKGDK